MNQELRAIQPQMIEEPNPLVPMTPMAMLSVAVQQGASLDMVAKLMDLQERHEANEARKAFTKAMADFKAEGIDIIKNKTVKVEGGPTYRHATLDEIVNTVAPVLTKYGLSHRWSVDQQGDRIRVTCVVQHVLGHSESVTLESAPDTSGKKNGIQSIGSAVAYLERYTLTAILGLASRDADNDGRGVDMPEAKFQGHMKAIREASSMEVLLKVFTDAYNEARGDHATQKALGNAKDKRKEELRGAK